MKRKRFIKTCLFCNKKIEVIKARKDKAKFCSRLCKTNSGRGKKPWNYAPLTKKCLCCKKMFKVGKYRKNTAKFCSKICRWKDGKINKICKVCGKNFTAVKSTYKKFNRPYCSMKCYNKVRCKKTVKRYLWNKIIDIIKRK